MDGPRKSIAYKTILAVTVVVAIVYLPMLGNGFVWDDIYSFFENPTYRDPSNLTKALTGALIYQENYFRPLPVLTFLVQIHVFEASSFGMHLASLSLHLINSLLVMLLSLELFRRFNTSWSVWSIAFVGLAYGLHPALIEPVSFISSRFDLMTTMFLLLALYADLRIDGIWKRAAVIGPMFLLAALCKEMAVGFVVALPFWHYFLSLGQNTGFREYIRNVKEKGYFKIYLSLFVAGTIYLILRYQALGLVFDSSLYTNRVHLSISEHIALVGLSIFQYMSLLVFPFGNISVAHPLPVAIGFSDYRVILGFLYILSVPAFFWLFFRNRVSWIVTFIVPLAAMFPVLGVIPLPRSSGAYFAESFLPFPLAMFMLMVAIPVNYLVKADEGAASRFGSISKSFLVLWILICGITVGSTIPVWKNNITLWSWARDIDPENILVRNNLAASFLKAKDFRKALKESYFVVNTDKVNDFAWDNLALSLNGLRDYRQAEQAAQRAVQLKPTKIEYRLTLGRIYYSAKEFRKAETELLRVVRDQPAHLYANVLLAQLYKDTKKNDLAKRHARMALDSLPKGYQRIALEKWLLGLQE